MVEDFCTFVQALDLKYCETNVNCRASFVLLKVLQFQITTDPIMRHMFKDEEQSEE